MTRRSGLSTAIRLPVRRVEADPDHGLAPDVWPVTVPAVARLLRDGLDLSPVTVLVGENGSGKSTLVEAIAAAYGLNAEGGSMHARYSTRVTESPLGGVLRLVRGIATPQGFFLRAETMHGLYTYLDSLEPGGNPASLHAMSHGESFLEVLATRFRRPGFYVLDEPESALSFVGCLALIQVLQDVVRAGGQVIVATHSPVVAALPGARLLEIGTDGWAERSWEDLDLVDHHRRFLASPAAYLRHLGAATGPAE